jgi:hypothetical protein
MRSKHMNELMKKFMSNFVIPLSLIIVVAVSGLFFQVSGHDSRIVATEADVVVIKEEVDSITESYNTIKQNQEQILYTLCLLVNNNDLSEC